MTERRSNRVAWGLAAILAGALIGLAVVAAWWASSRPDVEGTDRLISTHLPPGTDKTRVARFLDAHHWHHSNCEVPDATRKSDPGEPEYRASAVMYGSTDEWVDLKGFLNDYDTQLLMTFVFDSHGKLVRHVVRLLHIA